MESGPWRRRWAKKQSVGQQESIALQVARQLGLARRYSDPETPARDRGHRGGVGPTLGCVFRKDHAGRSSICDPSWARAAGSTVARRGWTARRMSLLFVCGRKHTETFKEASDPARRDMWSHFAEAGWLERVNAGRRFAWSADYFCAGACAASWSEDDPDLRRTAARYPQVWTSRDVLTGQAIVGDLGVHVHGAPYIVGYVFLIAPWRDSGFGVRDYRVRCVAGGGAERVTSRQPCRSVADPAMRCSLDYARAHRMEQAAHRYGIDLTVTRERMFLSLVAAQGHVLARQPGATSFTSCTTWRAGFSCASVSGSDGFAPFCRSARGRGCGNGTGIACRWGPSSTRPSRRIGRRSGPRSRRPGRRRPQAPIAPGLKRSLQSGSPGWGINVGKKGRGLRCRRP